MTVGDRIKNRRIELGMTQEELAAKMGYKGKSSVCAAETGGDNVTTTKVKKYAQALGVTPEFLMGWDDFEIAHDGNIIYDKNAIKEEILEELKNEEEVKKMIEFYTALHKSSPDVRSAVELLLGLARQPSVSPEKN